MSLDEFINRYNGQQITDNHGGYKGECVSLAKRYAQEVQGLDGDAVLYAPDGAAKNLYLQSTPLILENYDKVPYGEPRQRGDLVVWGYGTYGDVAVALDSGNQVFGQLGTPVFKPAATRNDNNQPLGYLRIKGGSDVSTVSDTEIDQMSWVYFGYGASQEFIHDHRGDESNTFERFMYNHPVAIAYRNQVAEWRAAAQSGGTPPKTTKLSKGLYEVQ